MGNEGGAVKLALQHRLSHLKRKRHCPVGLAGLLSEGAHAPSLGRDLLHIDVRIVALAHKAFRLAQDRAVFRNDIMAAEDQILRGLSLGSRAVNISAEKSRAG